MYQHKSLNTLKSLNILKTSTHLRNIKEKYMNALNNRMGKAMQKYHSLKTHTESPHLVTTFVLLIHYWLTIGNLNTKC